MSRETLAAYVTAELHIDLPGLYHAVNVAIEDCAHLAPLDLQRAASFIAYRVESTLGYGGCHLHYELGPAEFDDWHRRVARALAKAIQHESQ